MQSDTPQTTPFTGLNAEAIAAIADHYCIQRDPRRTAKVIGEVMAECARRLCEGYSLNGMSFEAQVTVYVPDDMPNLNREDFINAAAGLVQMIALWDVGQERKA